MRVSHSPIGLILAAVLLHAAALPVSAQDQHAWCRDARLQRNQVCEVRQLRFTPTSDNLVIDTGPNGNIEVEAYDGREVRVTARVLARAGSESASRDMARNVVVRTAGGAVRTEGPRRTGNHGWSVSVRVQVPAGTGIEATTTNGNISVTGAQAAVAARTTNGNITLSGVARRVDARSTNGRIRVSMGSDMRGFEGIEARTTNGAVHVELPAQLAADLDVSTTNGSITTELPVAVQGRVERRRLTGSIGAGGPPIRVRTTNGSVRITAL
jgi:hypothetical protein